MTRGCEALGKHFQDDGVKGAAGGFYPVYIDIDENVKAVEDRTVFYLDWFGSAAGYDEKVSLVIPKQNSKRSISV